jgi:hypothetical protein
MPTFFRALLKKHVSTSLLGSMSDLQHTTGAWLVLQGALCVTDFNVKNTVKFVSQKPLSRVPDAYSTLALTEIDGTT